MAAVTIHAHARRAVRETADYAAETGALIRLGAARRQQGRCRQAAGHPQRALDLSTAGKPP